MSNYHPEEYWSKVAERIENRESKNVIAGDDEPYYRYKREQFLALLNEVKFKDKSVLEIGHGPGGNLIEIWKHKPKSLDGVDISENMVALAKKNIPKGINLTKIDGTSLPFEDKTFDIVFTATVLQHNTDEQMMASILKELARVAGKNVYLFERIEDTLKGDALCVGRPVKYYSNILNESGFQLKSVKFINIRSSYFVSGFARKVLNASSRKEGEPLSRIAIAFQNISLPFTKILDKIFTSNKDVARLEFERI